MPLCPHSRKANTSLGRRVPDHTASTTLATILVLLLIVATVLLADAAETAQMHGRKVGSQFGRGRLKDGQLGALVDGEPEANAHHGERADTDADQRREVGGGRRVGRRRGWRRACVCPIAASHRYQYIQYEPGAFQSLQPLVFNMIFSAGNIPLIHE
jgi:hypothetical protein